MSLLSWRYEGTDSDRAAKDGGMQRVKAGDEVVDDEWGKGIISCATPTEGSSHPSMTIV